jgi:hypothetical protein
VKVYVKVTEIFALAFALASALTRTTDTGTIFKEMGSEKWEMGSKKDEG